MSKFKDFGAGASVPTEPINFALYGENFECRPALQGSVLLDLVASTNSEDAAASAAMVNTFFKSVLIPESYVRFEELVHDPDRIVSVETLAEISGWLVEEYTARPTEQPQSSPNGG